MTSSRSRTDSRQALQTALMPLLVCAVLGCEGPSFKERYGAQLRARRWDCEEFEEQQYRGATEGGGGERSQLANRAVSSGRSRFG